MGTAEHAEREPRLFTLASREILSLKYYTEVMLVWSISDYIIHPLPQCGGFTCESKIWSRGSPDPLWYLMSPGTHYQYSVVGRLEVPVCWIPERIINIP